jgi:ATP-dependent RNA helicase DeaD
MDKLLLQDISHGDYATYLPMLAEKFAHVSKEEILQRVASLEFDRFLKYYENAEDLNVREQQRQPRRNEGNVADQGRNRGDRNQRFSSDGSFTRLYVNLGSKDGFYKASFLQFILDMSELRKDVLGKIDMREMNTWIEVDSKSAKQMVKAIDGKNYRGRRIRMNEANSRG